MDQCVVAVDSLVKIARDDNRVCIGYGGKKLDDTVRKLSHRKVTSGGYVVPFTAFSCWELLRTLESNDIHYSADADVVSAEATEDLLRSYQSTIDSGSTPEGCNRRLFQHQKVGVKYISTALRLTGSALLLDDMGLGKTTTALTSLLYLGIDKVLVLCPKSVIGSWLQEIADVVPKWKAVGIVGDRTARRILIKENTANLVVQNYEGFRIDHKVHLDVKYQAIVIDEAHKIKNYKSKISRVVKKFKPRYRLVMTGTVLTTKLEDPFNICRWVCSDRVPDQLSTFRSLYCNYFGSDFIGYKDIDKFKLGFAPIMIARTKDECLDLPDKLYAIREVDLDENHRSMYNTLRDECILKLDGEERFVDRLALITRLAQAADGFHTLSDDVHPDESAKVRELDLVLDEVGGQKVVLWSRFVKNIKHFLERYSHLDPVSLYGATKDRDGNIRKFQNDPNCRLLVGQPQAGGLGVTLHAGTVCVFFDKLFQPDVIRQAEDRLHRIGQERNVTVVSIVAKDTIDERIEEVLASHKDLFNELMKGV